MTASGLKPPPRHPPAAPGLDGATCARFQRLMAARPRPPAGPDDETQARWVDGRTTAEVAAEFIKPNERLTAVERLQIYQRMYWYRLIGNAGDDCPGLRAVLGGRELRPAGARLPRAPSLALLHPAQPLLAPAAVFIREDRD